ncbi:MAG TPA: DUF6544 family protein [Bacteroidota bacterium]
MRYFLFVVTTVHGLIHLLGFVKAFGLAEGSQLTHGISKTAGVMWLIAGFFYIVAAVLYILHVDSWWIPAVPALLISQTLIFMSWGDAKFGTIATVIILVAVVIAIADALPGSFHNLYTADVRKGLDRIGDMPLVTEDDIRQLPDPVRKYLRYTGAIGKPALRNFRARFAGQFRNGLEGRWMNFTSQQYNFFDVPTRLFFMEAHTFGVPLAGFHRYVDSSATMQIRAASLFTVVDARGPIMTKGETVTLFNDMCVMAPASLIDKAIRWEPVDSLNAKATFSNHGYTIAAILSFNSDGALTDFSSNDRSMSADGVTFTNYRWSTPMKNYIDVGGRKIASYGETIWHTPEGEFVYGKFHLADIEYNCREFK